MNCAAIGPANEIGKLLCSNFDILQHLYDAQPIRSAFRLHGKYVLGARRSIPM